MTRRRYVYLNGELVEKDSASAPPHPSPDSGALWGDRSYAGLRATDGTPIDTRSKHREYMKLHDLTTMDDFKSEWQKSAQERAQALAGVDPARKQDLADVIYGRRPIVKPRGREDDPL